MRILVVTSEGASGSSLKRDDQFRTIVKSALPEYVMMDGNKLTIEYDIFNIIHTWVESEFEDKIKEYLLNMHGYDGVFLAGKSQGGDRTIEYVGENADLFDGLNIAVLTVDPCHWVTKHRRPRSLPLNMAGVNVYQQRSLWRLKGYAVGNAENTKITDKDVTHFNIIHYPIVKEKTEQLCVNLANYSCFFR